MGGTTHQPGARGDHDSVERSVGQDCHHDKMAESPLGPRVEEKSKGDFSEHTDSHAPLLTPRSSRAPRWLALHFRVLSCAIPVSTAPVSRHHVYHGAFAAWSKAVAPANM